MRHLPKPLTRAPGRLKSIINGLIDFAREAKPRAGAGLLMTETPDGIELSVNKTLQEIIDKHDAEVVTGEPTATFELPESSGIKQDDATKDLITIADTLVVSMHEINICVDAGGGTYTPMKMRVFSTAPYT